MYMLFDQESPALSVSVVDGGDIQHTHIIHTTDIATYRMNRPKGQFIENQPNGKKGLGQKLNPLCVFVASQYHDTRVHSRQVFFLPLIWASSWGRIPSKHCTEKRNTIGRIFLSCRTRALLTTTAAFHLLPSPVF